MSHLLVLEIDFWLLVVTFRLLPLNSGPPRVDLRPLEIIFWPLVFDFELYQHICISTSKLQIIFPLHI